MTAGGSREFWYDFDTLIVCSAGVLFAVLTVPSLQKVLSASVSAALGRYSFPLYLTHYTVICTFTSFAYVWTVQHGMNTFPVQCVIVLGSFAIFALIARMMGPVED
ncbi:MAG: acyltransferase family protein, partial [Terriglobales bacterium]